MCCCISESFILCDNVVKCCSCDNVWWSNLSIHRNECFNYFCRKIFAPCIINTAKFSFVTLAVLGSIIMAIPIISFVLSKFCANNCCGHNLKRNSYVWSEGDLMFLLCFNRYHVETLKIDSSDITSIPDKIEKLVDLRELIVLKTQLNIFSPKICELRNLKFLQIDTSELTSISSNINNLIHLEHLEITNSQLLTLPESIGGLINLKKLILNHNLITSLPETIGNMTNLEHLNLNSNRLESFPESITKLSQLNYLSFAFNRFVLFPIHLLKLKTLTNVHFDTYEFRNDNRFASKLIINSYFNPDKTQIIKNFKTIYLLAIARQTSLL